MPGKFAQFGVTITIPPTRAVGDDPSQVINECADHWDDLQKNLERMSDDENGELLDLFNQLIEPFGEHDDLGDILFGDYTSFQKRVEGLTQENQQKYTDALQEQGIVQFDQQKAPETEEETKTE